MGANRQTKLVSLVPLAALAALAATRYLSLSSAFVQPHAFRQPSPFRLAATSTKDLLALSLEKPLGMILEEVEEGAASGVFVKEVAETGSAVPYADQIVGAVLSTVGGTDVTTLDFDSAMELLISAPESVDLEFLVDKPPVEFKAGTVVTIVVQQNDKPNLELEAKVGDNLRKTLIDNGVEVYKGLKQTLGNCGGAGQCTFCAVDFIESEGWTERSEYEDGKLKRFPAARLACLNNIQGPATIQKTER